MTAVTPRREELLSLADEIETSDGLYRLDSKLGEHQGYQIGIKKTAQVVAALRLAAKSADDGVREEAAYAAYLGICVLATMCKKAGLLLAEKRATKLLIEMGEAFPSFAGRSALRTSTTGAPKP